MENSKRKLKRVVMVPATNVTDESFSHKTPMAYVNIEETVSELLNECPEEFQIALSRNEKQLDSIGLAAGFWKYRTIGGDPNGVFDPSIPLPLDTLISWKDPFTQVLVQIDPGTIYRNLGIRGAAIISSADLDSSRKGILSERFCSMNGRIVLIEWLEQCVRAYALLFRSRTNGLNDYAEMEKILGTSDEG